MTDFEDFELDGAAVGSLAVEIETEEPTSEYGRPPVQPALMPQRVHTEQLTSEWKRRASASGSQPLYFDLETIPDYSRLESFGLDPVPEVPSETDLSSLPDPTSLIVGTENDIKATLAKIVAPSAWIDQVAAAERGGKARKGVLGLIEDARNVRASAIAAHAERRKLLSVTPEYCSIAAMGWAVGGDVVCSVVAGQKDDAFQGDNVVTEGMILTLFWGLVQQHGPIVVFNGMSFDLRVIAIRSSLLAVAPSRMIDMRPFSRDVIDPYVIRFGGRGASSGQPGKLKTLARLHGINVPAGDVDGSQVEELMKTDPAKVGLYVRSDVEILRSYHKALSGFLWV